MVITKIITGLITNTTMVTTMSTNSTTDEAISSMNVAMIAEEEEVMSSKGTTIGTMIKTDSSQGVTIRIALTNASKRTATLSRLPGEI